MSSVQWHTKRCRQIEYCELELENWTSKISNGNKGEIYTECKYNPTNYMKRTLDCIHLFVPLKNWFENFEFFISLSKKEEIFVYPKKVKIVYKSWFYLKKYIHLVKEFDKLISNPGIIIHSVNISFFKISLKFWGKK